MSDNGGQSPNGAQGEAAQTEHLNIKVTDGNNEVFFKIKRSTKLEKLMKAFCERQGKDPQTVRFLFDGQRVQKDDSPETVGSLPCVGKRSSIWLASQTLHSERCRWLTHGSSSSSTCQMVTHSRFTKSKSVVDAESGRGFPHWTNVVAVFLICFNNMSHNILQILLF